jgi:hypothetical protein
MLVGIKWMFYPFLGKQYITMLFGFDIHFLSHADGVVGRAFLLEGCFSFKSLNDWSRLGKSLEFLGVSFRFGFSIFLMVWHLVYLPG